MYRERRGQSHNCSESLSLNGWVLVFYPSARRTPCICQHVIPPGPENKIRGDCAVAVPVSKARPPLNCLAAQTLLPPGDIRKYPCCRLRPLLSSGWPEAPNADARELSDKTPIRPGPSQSVSSPTADQTPNSIRNFAHSLPSPDLFPLLLGVMHTTVLLLI